MSLYLQVRKYKIVNRLTLIHRVEEKVGKLTNNLHYVCLVCSSEANY